MNWWNKKPAPAYPTQQQIHHIDRDKLLGAALNAVADQLDALRADMDKLMQGQAAIEAVLTTTEGSRNSLVSMINHELHEIMGHLGRANGLKKKAVRKR